MPLTYTTKHDRVDTVRAQDVNRLQDDVALMSRQVFNVKERTYGAVLDGATDDGDAIRDTVAAASAAGGGTVLIPGPAAFSGAVIVPTGVNIQGVDGNSNAAGTVLTALDAAACLKFGEQEVGSYGGVSGNFCLDGNNVSPNMLYLGRTLERTFQNIAVMDCASGSAAVLIEEAQNNQFMGLWVGNNAGDGICFDRGAAGNRIYGLESSTNGSAAAGGHGGANPAHIRFTATDATVASLVAYPLNNQIFGGIVERDGGNCDALVYHGAGADNRLWGVNLSLAGATRAAALVKMEVGNAGITSQSTRLVLIDPFLTGSTTYTTAFDLDDASIVILEGRPFFQGFVNAYLLRDASSQVWGMYRALYSNVTNRNAVASVGVLNTALRSRVGDPIDIQRSVTGDTAVVVSVEGDAGIRYHQNAIGTMVWGGGTDAGDTNLFRSSANLLRTNDSLQVDQGLWSSAVRNVTTTATVAFTDNVITADASSGAFTVNLPSTSGLTGFQVTIIRTSASNNVTVDANGTDTISGPGINAALTATLGSQHAYATFACTAANVWRIVAMGGTVT